MWECRLWSCIVVCAGASGGWAELGVLGAAAWAWPAYPAAQGSNVATWFIDAKRTRASCTCFASSCRGPISRGDLRVRSAASTANPRWYHASCVEGGLGPLENLEGFAGLQQEEQAKAQTFCDRPGGVSRAEYVEAVRQAKRQRRQAADPGEANPPVGEPNEHFDELPEDQDAANHDTGCRVEELRNMAWWDTVWYDELENWVPTLGRTPRDVHHGLAIFRGTVCRDIRHAREAGDAAAESRACKLLTFMDRLVLTATQATRGGRKHKGSLSSTITARLRLAGKGGRGQSLASSGGHRARRPARSSPGEPRQRTPAQSAR